MIDNKLDNATNMPDKETGGSGLRRRASDEKGMPKKHRKAKYYNLTIPMGTDAAGQQRVGRWREAALKVMHDNPKLLNTWIRFVVDAEADKILGPIKPV